MVEPEAESKLKVYWFIVYCAVKSVGEVIFVKLDGLHPVKVYPVRVGDVGAIALFQYATDHELISVVSWSKNCTR